MAVHVDTLLSEIAGRAVHELLRQRDPGAFAPHFQHPAMWAERDTPAPLAAARAARELTLALQRHAVESALAARGAGEAWEDVAVALGQRVGGQPDAAAAYLRVLGVPAGGTWWSPSRGVLWTCSSCEEVVRDFGPEAGGPEDRESGHAPDCSRHSADVVAWGALWA